MQFAHGLDLKRENVNKILEIAQKKGYLVDINFEFDDFKFNQEKRIFELNILNTNSSISLEMDKFIECYTELLLK